MTREMEKSKKDRKIYVKPSLIIVDVDSELSLVMLSNPPMDPGNGFIEGIKLLIR